MWRILRDGNVLARRVKNLVVREGVRNTFQVMNVRTSRCHSNYCRLQNIYAVFYNQIFKDVKAHDNGPSQQVISVERKIKKEKMRQQQMMLYHSVAATGPKVISLT